MWLNPPCKITADEANFLCDPLSLQMSYSSRRDSLLLIQWISFYALLCAGTPMTVSLENVQCDFSYMCFVRMFLNINRNPLYTSIWNLPLHWTRHLRGLLLPIYRNLIYWLYLLPSLQIAAIPVLSATPLSVNSVLVSIVLLKQKWFGAYPPTCLLSTHVIF